MPLKFANNQSLTSVTALPSAVPTDNLILISTQTASASATISFTTGLNSTYDEYIFKFINCKIKNTDPHLVSCICNNLKGQTTLNLLEFFRLQNLTA